jgi:hypothetical protein|tara:strand:+ start:14863 stop:15060 length:198 start_codon:yes stop_codon:yes gene_type:complete
MPIPGSIREKQFLSEIAEQNVAPPVAAPEFLQEIKEPTHDHEELVEEVEEPIVDATEKKKSRWKK